MLQCCSLCLNNRHRTWPNIRRFSASQKRVVLIFCLLLRSRGQQWYWCCKQQYYSSSGRPTSWDIAFSFQRNHFKRPLYSFSLSFGQYSKRHQITAESCFPKTQFDWLMTFNIQPKSCVVCRLLCDWVLAHWWLNLCRKCDRFEVIRDLISYVNKSNRYVFKWRTVCTIWAVGWALKIEPPGHIARLSIASYDTKDSKQKKTWNCFFLVSNKPNLKTISKMSC